MVIVPLGVTDTFSALGCVVFLRRGNDGLRSDRLTPCTLWSYSLSSIPSRKDHNVPEEMPSSTITKTDRPHQVSTPQDPESSQPPPPAQPPYAPRIVAARKRVKRAQRRQHVNALGGQASRCQHEAPSGEGSAGRQSALGQKSMQVCSADKDTGETILLIMDIFRAAHLMPMQERWCLQRQAGIGQFLDAGSSLFLLVRLAPVLPPAGLVGVFFVYPACLSKEKDPRPWGRCGKQECIPLYRMQKGRKERRTTDTGMYLGGGEYEEWSPSATSCSTPPPPRQGTSLCRSSPHSCSLSALPTFMRIEGGKHGWVDRERGTETVGDL